MSFFGKKPRALGDLIEDFVEGYPHRKSLKKGMILSLWPRIVGKNIAEVSQDLQFKGDKLMLRIENPGWRHELHMQRHAIMKKLNREVNEEIVKDIVVRG